MEDVGGLGLVGLGGLGYFCVLSFVRVVSCYCFGVWLGYCERFVAGFMLVGGVVGVLQDFLWFKLFCVFWVIFAFDCRFECHLVRWILGMFLVVFFCLSGGSFCLNYWWVSFVMKEFERLLGFVCVC